MAARAGIAGLAAVVLLLDVLVVTNPTPRDAPGWRRHAPIPDARGETAAAVAGDRLFVVGGFGGIASTSPRVDVYDPAADRWTRGPDLPAGRHHAAAAGRGDTVYVSGGARSAFDWTTQRDLWALRPDAGAWRRLPPMPAGRQGHAMVAIGPALYVVGGDGDGDTAAVLVHEVGRGWSTGAPMPEPRDHLRAVVVGGEVWALGGRTDDRPTTRVDVYDPAADRWRRGPDLPTPMSAMAAGVVGGRIHVVGGEDPRPIRGGVTDRHVSLDPAERRWRTHPRPLLAVHGAGAGVVAGRLFVAGGSRRQGALSPLAWADTTQSFRPPAGG